MKGKAIFRLILALIAVGFVIHSLIELVASGLNWKPILKIVVFSVLVFSNFYRAFSKTKIEY